MIKGYQQHFSKACINEKKKEGGGCLKKVKQSYYIHCKKVISVLKKEWSWTYSLQYGGDTDTKLYYCTKSLQNIKFWIALEDIIRR